MNEGGEREGCRYYEEKCERGGYEHYPLPRGSIASMGEAKESTSTRGDHNRLRQGEDFPK